MNVLSALTERWHGPGASTVLVVALAAYAVFLGIGFQEQSRNRRRAAELERRIARAEEYVSLWDVRRCRVCGCTDDIACATGCWWVDDDLCSSCDDDQAAAASSLEGPR